MKTVRQPVHGILAIVALFAVSANSVHAQDAPPANALQQFSDAFEWAANQVKPATVMIRLGNSVGTGAIIEPSGYIITNNHVVKTAGVVDVFLPGRRDPYKGKVLGVNPTADLALVKIEGGPFPAARLGNSDLVRSGHLVIAIGSPRGLSQTVTTGVISGRRGGGTNIAQKLQHDAPINPGNSGGPLVNLDGEIIGVNNSIRSAADKGNNGIGFAIPSNIVKQLLPSLLAGGSGPPPQQQPAQPAAPRAYLGVELAELEDGDPQKAQIPGGNGIVIVAVSPDTPAAKGGLKDGDIILRYNNIVADSVEKLVAHIGASKPGASLTLLIFRDGKSLTFTITLGERK